MNFLICISLGSVSKALSDYQRRSYKKKLKNNWAEAYLFMKCSLFTNKNHCFRELDKSHINVSNSSLVLTLRKSLRLSRTVRSYKLKDDQKHKCKPAIVHKKHTANQFNRIFLSAFYLHSLLCVYRL